MIKIIVKFVAVMKYRYEENKMMLLSVALLSLSLSILGKTYVDLYKQTA